MTCVFDKEMWQFRNPQQHDSEMSIVRVDVIKPSHTVRRVSQLKLVAPADLFKFCLEVLHVTDMADLELVVEQDEERWYLTAIYRHREHDLWYYTQSTMPFWLEKALK